MNKNNYRKLDPIDICLKYNSVRDKNAGRSFTNEQVINLLKEAGLSASMAIRIAANSTLLTKFRREGQGRGKHIGYQFPYESIHKSFFNNWLYPPTKSEKQPVIKRDSSFEDECVAYLKNLGYKIMKPVQFDIKKFEEDNPELFLQYQICKEV